MAGRGGKREGSGRPKGSRNRRTEMQIEAASNGILPLDFLLGLMRDPAQNAATRLTAAISAAPYVHPKLATTTLKGDADAPVALELKGSDVHG